MTLLTLLPFLLFLGAFALLFVFLFKYAAVLSAFSYSAKVIIVLFLSLSISSFVFFISLLIGFRFHFFLGVLCLGLILFARISKQSAFPSLQNLLPRLVITGQQVVVAALVLLYTRNFFLKSERWGNWDAWAIWNMHARFLSFEHEWQQMFSNRIAHWTHSDYPIMLPSIVAFVWKSTGVLEPYTPIIVAYIVAMAILLLLYSATPPAYRSVLGIASMILLVSDFNFLSIAVSQGADTLLGLFYLLSLVCFYYQTTDQRIAFLTGFFGAACGWIKNEGLLFYMVLVLFFVGTHYKSYNKKLFLYFITGSALPLSIILLYKLGYAPDNEIVQSQSVKTLNRLLTPSLYLYIGKYIINTLFLKFPLVLPGIIISVYLGIRKREGILFALLATIIAGYFVVYLTTPYDLYWHISTSCERLIHQLYPSLLFAFSNSIAVYMNSQSGFIPQQSDLKG